MRRRDRIVTRQVAKQQQQEQTAMSGANNTAPVTDTNTGGPPPPTEEQEQDDRQEDEHHEDHDDEEEEDESEDYTSAGGDDTTTKEKKTGSEEPPGTPTGFKKEDLDQFGEEFWDLFRKANAKRLSFQNEKKKEDSKSESKNKSQSELTELERMALELSRLRTENLHQTAEIAARDKTIAYQDSQLRYDYSHNLVSTPNGPHDQPPPRRPAPQRIPMTPVFQGDRTVSSQSESGDKGPRPRFNKWTLNFDPNKTTLTDYLYYFNITADLNEYTDSEKCHQLLCGFQTDALRIAKRLGTGYNFETLVRTLYGYYEPAESRQTKQVKLNNLQRKPGEKARDFANRVQDLVSSCFSSLDPIELDDMVLARFIQGHDVSIKASLLTRTFRNIDEAVTVVDILEESNVVTVSKETSPLSANAATASTKHDSKESKAKPSTRKRRDAVQVNLAEEEEDCPDELSVYAVDIDAMVDVCLASLDDDDDVYEDDVLDALATKVYRKYPAARSSAKCFYCGTPGHRWLKCYQLLSRLQKLGYKPRQRPKARRAQAATPRQASASAPAPAPRDRTSKRSPGRRRGAKSDKLKVFWELMSSYMANEVSSDEKSDDDEGKDLNA